MFADYLMTSGFVFFAHGLLCTLYLVSLFRRPPLPHPIRVVDIFPTENNRGSVSLERGNDFHLVRFNSLEKCYESQ